MSRTAFFCRAAAAGSRHFSTSRASALKVAFLGVGNMGRHMCANLVKAGHAVAAYDVSPAGAAAAAAAGASAAQSIAAAAAGADVVVTMLPNSPHVREAYEGRGGVFEAGPAPGALLLDCSTIDPAAAASLGAAAARRGLRFLDAPVSGGVGGAEKGTLTFMVGGAPDAFAAAAAPGGVLRAMGKNVVHTGGPGTGQVAKICNNMVLGVSMAAVAEAMNLGVRLGADAKTLAGIINSSSGRCWASDTYNPVPGVMEGVPAAKGYAGGFGTALLVKDMGLALAAGRAVGAPLPAAAAAATTYETMLARGHNLDFSSVYAWLAGKPL